MIFFLLNLGNKSIKNMIRADFKRLSVYTMLLIALIFSTITSAQGAMQQGPSASDLAKRKTDHMKTQLSLDQKQYKEIYKINLQQFKEMAQRGGAEGRPKMGEGPQIGIKNEKKFKEILTPEQFLKWRKMEEEKQNRMPLEVAPAPAVK